MSARVFLLSIVAAQSLCAMNVDRHNFFTRDYLDFGQNLGQFSADSKNITIMKKDGTKVALPNLPFPDFLKFDGSNRTSVGGAYTASSKHVVAPNQNRFVLKNFKLGETTYTDIKINPYLNDSAFTRVNKFIVEGGYRITNFQDIKKNPQDYHTNYDGEERIILYRSGQGLMSFGDWQGSPQASDSVKSPGIAGNFFYLKLNEINDSNKLVVNNNNYGPLRGLINTGDSGSPALVFNNKRKEWELIGTAWGATRANNNQVANTFFSIAIPSKLEEFKKQFEVQKETNRIEKFEKDKDNVYSENGTININEEVVNAGGIILRGEQKTLNVNGNSRFAGAGVDVTNKNSKIVWNVSTKDDLHKIGKGTLEVVKATDGKLRMGEGITRLKAKDSFKEVHLAHREGVLIIDAENATDYNKLSFGKNGGRLDLNGYSAVMEGVKAFNANAIISNNAEKISTLRLNNKKNIIVHATFGGNIKIQAGATNETNVAIGKIIFDGGFHLKSLFGDNQHIVLQGKPVPHATWKDGYLSLPPIPPFWGAKEYFIGHYIDKFDKEKANLMDLRHMVVNQTVTLTQPDWIQREYSGMIALSGQSKLFIERNADIIADITLNDSSQLTFNSKLLYIDTKDSKELEQDVQSQTIDSRSVKDTITFRGKLTANAQSKIVSNGIKELSASIDLSGDSNLDAKQDEIKILKEGLRLKDNSSFTAKALHVKNINKSSIFVDKNSQLNIDELKLEKSEIMFNIKNENLNFKVNLDESILNVADESKIPQNINLKKSTLAFENINSTLSLKSSTFDDTSILKIKNLTHKQNDNGRVTWRNNGVKHIILSDSLKLENVGNGKGDEKFLALKLDDVEMSFANTGRVVVSFVENYLDNDTTLGRLYDVIMLQKLTSQGDLLVHFEGQDSNSKIQAIATKTNTGIKISFAQDNQVSAERIMSAIDNRTKHHQFFLLSDFIATHANHPLVLDVAFNKNNTHAIDRIVERIEKIDSDAKNISKTITQNTNSQIISHYNKITSKRIGAIQNNISASNEISPYLYASLVSDVPLPISNVENPHNSMWVNTGGGYFDSNGHLKYFSTTFGYDKQFMFNERDAILGLLMSFGKSYASNSAYNDNTSNYGFGLYGALTHDAHELQFSNNYVIGKSKKYNKLSMDRMTDRSFGISGIYKYAFEFDTSKTKPIFGLEYIINKMAGYTLDIMKVKPYDYRALNGILGVECGYTKENLFLSAGITGKKAIARTNDKIHVGIDGSNRFVGYDLQSDRLIYNLDLTANYKINDALLLETNVNLQTTLKGDDGVSGLLKGEYRF